MPVLGTHATVHYDVQVMAPFTPFFCESLYQNLRRALPEDAPTSVHWCDFPLAAAEQVWRTLLEHGIRASCLFSIV